MIYFYSFLKIKAQLLRCINSLTLAILLTISMSIKSAAQEIVYDEDSKLALQAELRRQGIRIDLLENCQIDLFQLSKRILDCHLLNQFRLQSEDRFIAIDRLPNVRILLMSRDWIQQSSGKLLGGEILMENVPAMVYFNDENSIEILPNKLEIGKQ
jgi:hypothetical protein